ncbi:MAG: M20 family metallo-hydrolase [Ferroplasma sp.]|uniref:M20 family metallo-hydrolase n=1 Tax=Ferroplasma sp. TaxID=2591003 RepID=UPI002815FDFB|nr:M20 family metallo-hydrolase [Ferroplasma sp.]WMT50789.1 MAG: M20 family metallo-hydrolase [Ferroplasma sp.]
MSYDENADREFIINSANKLLSIRAISPLSGGEGEYKKSRALIKILKGLGYDNLMEYNVEDSSGHIRPNIILMLGNFQKTLWIISHLDTVPEGDPELWKHEPFSATVEGDKIYGRGSEDNGQSIFTTLLLLKNLDESRLKINLGMAFVSDEETGNDYGIKHLIRQNIFKPDDLIIVPDAGTNEGFIIETAEKTAMQLKFEVLGRQGHASMPANSINAFRESCKFVNAMDSALHGTFSRENPLFVPPYSTFEPTKHEKNIDNINTIPGREVFYWDFRILPEYPADQVLEEINNIISSYSKNSDVKISYKVTDRVDAPSPTPDDSEIIIKLKKAIKAVTGKDAVTVGIGGETFASFLRTSGYRVAVWSTTAIENAHMPDEFCLIPHILQDVRIYEEMIYN